MTDTDYRPVAQNQEPEKKSLAALIEQMKPEIARVLPRHLDADRMARIATTVLRQTPALGRTTPESFMGALMTCSQLGLEPGPLGEAYLVPYGQTCTFIPGYRGLVKLAYQSGMVTELYAEVAYERDDFTYTLGLERDLTHKPYRGGERGAPTDVYAVAKLKGGGLAFEVMTVADVERIRARSKAGKNGPWVTDWEAMAKKTVVKQLAKWLPLSSEFVLATGHDESARTNIASELVDVEPDYIDGTIIDDASPAEPTPENPEVVQPPLKRGAAASKGLKGLYFKLFTEADCPGRDDRMIVTRWILHRDDIDSSDDLDAIDMKTVVDTLDGWKKAGELGAKTTDALQAWVASQAEDDAADAS